MEKPLLNVWDVMAFTGCSKAAAYKIIRDLNKELKQRGFYTIQGKVNSDYFKEKFNLTGNDYIKLDPEELKQIEKGKEQDNEE